MPRDCARFAPFHVSRKCCIFIFYFENLLRWNFLVCLHINYRYVSILVQIGQPVATSGKSATPIDEKCALFAPPDARSCTENSLWVKVGEPESRDMVYPLSHLNGSLIPTPPPFFRKKRSGGEERRRESPRYNLTLKL